MEILAIKVKSYVGKEGLEVQNMQAKNFYVCG